MTLPASAVFDEEDYPRIADLKAKAKQLFFTNLPSLIAEHGILAGGAFASWMHGDDPKDFDIFFLDTPEVREMYNDWFIPHLVGDGSYGLKKKSYTGSSAYMKLELKEVWDHPNRRAQYIFTDYKTRQELIDDFDFVHAKISFQRPDSNKEGTIYTSKQTLDAIRLMHLIPTGRQTISKERINKFLDRGWIEVKKPETVVPVWTDAFQPTGVTVDIETGAITSTIPGPYPNVTIQPSSWTQYPQTLTPSEDFKEEIRKLLGTYNPGEEEKKKIEAEKAAIKRIVEEKPKLLVDGGRAKIEESPDWFKALKDKLTKPWDY
jgi:hypothetical protein